MSTQTSTSLVEKLKLINGGEVRLACPSLHDVKQQGVAFLGSSLGSHAFIVQEWQEALEKKKMADNVFYKLSQQDQNHALQPPRTHGPQTTYNQRYT